MIQPAFPAASFRTFVSELGTGKQPAADHVAELFAHHLTETRIETLPPAAQPIWAQVAKLLKTDAQRAPMPEKSVAAVKSWPATRVTELVEALRQIDSLIDQAENDRLNDEIRINVARAYL